jgi:osmotically-inducible protein OsmY
MKTKTGIAGFTYKALALAVALGASGYVMAENSSSKYDMDNAKSDVREAWLDGKLETAFLLNRHLNNFTIDSEVDGNSVELEGEVESDIDKELAEQIALSVDGIEHVNNELKVVPESKTKNDDQEMDENNDRSFSQQVDDATLTAEIKMELLANSNTQGLKINVDTRKGKVTLKGTVASSTEKDLAEKLAGNVDGVVGVKNELRAK